MFGIGKFFRRDDKAKAEEQEAPRTEGDAPAGSEAAAPYEPDRAAEADFVPDPDALLEDAPAAADLAVEQGEKGAGDSLAPQPSASPLTSGLSGTPGSAAPTPVVEAGDGATAPSPAAEQQAFAAEPAPSASQQQAFTPEPAPSVPQQQAFAAEPTPAAEAEPAPPPVREPTAPLAPDSPPASSSATAGASPAAPAIYAQPSAAPAPLVPAAPPAPQPTTAPRPSPAPENGGFFSRLKAGLSKTRDNLAEGLSALVLGRKTIDEDLLEDIETQLLSADLGLEATTEVLEELRRRVKRKQLADSDALLEALKQILFDLLQPTARPLELPPPGGDPFVILMVGVNGVGKTTTIGKLAKRYQQEGRDVLLAAGDTFRAAAVEQLQAWGEHNGVPVIAQHTGADSASVIYDAYQAARARRADVLIADTAGRLHTKSNLMQELEKVLRVLRKLEPSLPQEVLLVLDATTGQNALSQAKHFTEAVQVTGLVITKLDGSAKGGMVFAIAKQLDLPIRYIGIGERADDLRPFDARQFVDALFATR